MRGGGTILGWWLKGALLCVFFAALPVVAADISTELSEGEVLFVKALQGDKRALRRAQRKFRMAEQKHPDHPLVNAYLGALIALQGRDASRAVEKSRLVDQALVKMDAALQSTVNHPNDVVVVLETKLVVARTQVNLPPFFNRLIEGRRLVEEVMADKFFSVMPAHFQAAAYMTAAQYADKQNRDDESKRYLALAMGVAPESLEAQQARYLLRQMEGGVLTSR